MATTTSTTSTPLSTGATPAANTGTVTPYTNTGSVSSWAQPYVNDMLSTASGLADKPYTPYTGELVAGQTGNQTSAFSGIGSLTAPDATYNSPLGTWDTQTAQTYMNPYLQTALNPQLDEARRQSQITQLGNDAKMTQAGAFGGSRQALLTAENQRNLGTTQAGIVGTGYKNAYDTALGQWNTEQGRKAQDAQFGANYGLAALKSSEDLINQKASLGAQERDIQQQKDTAAYQQWQNQMQYPYEQLKFQQSMLSGLPITTSEVSRPAMSAFEKVMATGNGALAAVDWAKKAGLIGDQTTMKDILQKGYGWLFGGNTGVGNGYSQQDVANLDNYISQQVATGAMTADEANYAMNQTLGFNTSGNTWDFYGTGSGDYLSDQQLADIMAQNTQDYQNYLNGYAVGDYQP